MMGSHERSDIVPFGASEFLDMGGCPVHGKMVSRILGLHPVDVSSTSPKKTLDIAKCSLGREGKSVS